MWWAPLLNNIAALFGTGAAASTNSYESIATVTVGAGGSSSISFTSIPSTYKHLQIRGIARTTQTTNAGNDGTYLSLQFNSDTGANYVTHQLLGDGASASANGFTGLNGIYYQRFSNANAGSNIFGGSVLDILDYANTNKTKVTRNLAGFDNNGGGRIYLSSGLWNNTAAITSITLTPEPTASFSQYSSFALYGVK